MIDQNFLVIVLAHWQLDNANSPAALLQEKTARKPHTLRVADVVRTYIPQVGYLFSSFHTWYAIYNMSVLVCTKEKAQHGTTAQQLQ